MKPLITRGTYRGKRGEFSTVMLPDGLVETCFFPGDGSVSTVVFRQVPRSLRSYHDEAVAVFDGAEW